jgi:acetyl-CoA synthetase
LLHGATEVMYEGAPDFPDASRMWDILQKYKVTIFYTTPTALRMFMKFGDDIPNSFDLSSLRLLGTVGEPINPEVWKLIRKSGNGISRQLEKTNAQL